jgi:DNA-binding Lrp family transcriptional regulator
MVTSYTLARVHPAMDRDVYNKVKNFSEVKEVIITYGEYDLILKIESNSLEDLDDFVFNKLRRIEGVAATTTLLEARPEEIVEEG